MIRKGVAWLDRGLFISPYYYGLCLSKEKFHAELKRLKVPRGDWPEFLGANANATCHSIERADGKLAAIVAIGSCEGRTREQVYALLVHEAVHIWQRIRAYIGETSPSSEFEAYSVQSIAQELMQSYADQTKKGRKK